MRKVFLPLLLLSVFVSGCATTRVIVSPVTYHPSLLKKNPADVSYYVDSSLKALTENYKGLIESYTLEVGHGLYSSIKNTMSAIFYDPEEVTEIGNKKPTIKFTLVDSKLKREWGKPPTDYELKVRVEIIKGEKKLDEIILTEEGTYPYGFPDRSEALPEQEGKEASRRAVGRIIHAIGEFLMNYNFNKGG